MAKNTSKRKKDIKSKLIAAICMLLVSTIMMVSSTYAWFTLSTAPEVTSITTTIGSNGALEIALSPVDGSLNGVKDATMSTSTDWTERNLTWGNLLDLSDDSYNLENLVLSPTVLLANGTAINTNPLGTPSYGSDGRISDLIVDKTVIGGMNTDNTGYLPGGGQYGVRAVGTASGMSAQQLAFKTNIAAIGSYASNATVNASESISANGNALASMLVQHAAADDQSNDTYDYKEHVPALTALTDDLSKSVDAMTEAVRAALYVGATTIDENYDAAVTAIKALTTLEEMKTAATTYGVNGLATIIDNIIAIRETVKQAKTDVATLATKDKVLWNDASAVLNVLMNTTGITVGNETNGYYTVSELKSKMSDTNFMLKLAQNCQVLLGAGSGVYYDIAVVAGNITAVTTATVDASAVASGMTGDITLENVVIKTVYTGTSKLPGLKTTLSTSIKPVEGSDDAVMDTFYGYVIDLMFRTNAADSKLLLQTEAAQRVYDDSNNTATMGGGSTLTFTANTVEDAGAIKGLVESIRIVFFDPSNSSIYGIARATTISTTEATVDGTTTYTIVGKLELCTYTVDTNTNQVTVGDALTDSKSETTYNDGAVLCDLAQNTAKAVSALVYLDGTDVTNADVLYNADVLGALNLQFASSVNLEPMDNSELFNGASSSSTAAGSN